MQNSYGRTNTHPPAQVHLSRFQHNSLWNGRRLMILVDDCKDRGLMLHDLRMLIMMMMLQSTQSQSVNVQCWDRETLQAHVAPTDETSSSITGILINHHDQTVASLVRFAGDAKMPENQSTSSCMFCGSVVPNVDQVCAQSVGSEQCNQLRKSRDGKGSVFQVPSSLGCYTTVTWPPTTVK